MKKELLKQIDFNSGRTAIDFLEALKPKLLKEE